ncbi:poly-gamma-glutamate hydrolase family protein [Candidatus Woesearchaeota archaeon]|nr:poly-gamma-glutamate hydrolase family protein [Candidatus Woesearchaeota archaeon]
MGKSGISPLIATILLIGFTIILAILVFRFTADLAEKTIEFTDIARDINCLIDLSIGNFCIDSGYARFHIRNNDNINISDFIFTTHYDDAILVERVGTGLNPFQTDIFYTPYQGANYSYIEVRPGIELNGNSGYCLPNIAAIGDLNYCETALAFCGDSVVNQAIEECDGLDLDGKTCSDFSGFSEGALSCYPAGHLQQCKFNTENCIATQPPQMNFGILDAYTDTDFWYPLKIRIQNSGDDIDAFKIQIQGSINDEYTHTQTIFSGETKEINVFYRLGVGDIYSIDLIPGRKRIPIGESVEFDWYPAAAETISQIIDNTNWDVVLGYWTFKQGGLDTVVYDKSPQSKNCNVDPSAAPIWEDDRYCLFGRCYSIDGDGNGLSCADPSYFDNGINNQITIEALVRPWRINNPAGVPKNRIIASKYFQDAYQFRSWIFRLDEDTESLRFRIYRDTGSGGDSFRTVDADPNRNFTVGAIWHHLVGQYDGDDMRLYVDGELVGENDFPSSQSIIDSPTANVMIGDWQNLGGDTFNGRLESVAIYNTYLDETTIKKHANDLYSLTNCPVAKRTNEPDYCEHVNVFGINNSVGIDQASGWGRRIGSRYVGLREYLEFSDSVHTDCDVAIMAVHGGSVEAGTEQMARYMYDELVEDRRDVALWVYGSRNTDCSICDSGCEDVCHHVTSNSIDPNCDPYLREILSSCKIGIALHGCADGCPATSQTNNLPPVLIGGRSEYRFKELIENELSSSLGSSYYIINFDDVRDCKFFVDDITCYRGADYCNIVNQFPRFASSNGLPGIQIEMPPEMRDNALVSRTDEECDAATPPEDCLTRFENEAISGDTKDAADAYVKAIKSYIDEKEW